MWFRKLSHYLLAHPYVALPIMFLLASSTVVDSLKVAPLILLLMLGGAFSLTYAGLVTLLQGELIGGCFMAAVTAPYLIKLGLILYATHTPSSPEFLIIIGIVFSCLLNLLVWVIACLIRRGYSWSTLLQSVTLLGIFGLCLVSLFYPHLTEWWVSVLQKPAELAQKQALVVSGQPVITPEMQKRYIEEIAVSASGMMTAGLVFCALMQVMLSRWWQGFLSSPELLSKELAGIRLSRLTGVLFALGLLASSLGEFYSELNNDLVTGFMPVAYMLFLIVGLILVHHFFGMVSSKARMFWILFFYIFFIYMMPFSVVMIAMIALFDIWIDLRKRFSSV